MRGPPGISIRKPKVKFDPQFDTEMFRQNYAELENMMDMYDNQILTSSSGNAAEPISLTWEHKQREPWISR